MVDVQIAPSARADLEAIDDYGIEMFGIEAADAMSDGIRRAFAFLGEYPLRPPYDRNLAQVCAARPIAAIVSFIGSMASQS